ncbi:hypothetical protein ZWY2020_052936 [Hordeum vulgare]|nr:hypothetical protein ZWY2020_052936 [Hordeum vulgare]
MNKNLGKRAAEPGAEDPQWKQSHVNEGPNSGDDDFSIADFVRDVHTARRKYCFPPKSQPKWSCDDGDDDADAESDREAGVVPKTAPMPPTSGDDDSFFDLNDELGFLHSQSIGVKDLVQKLAELVEDDDHVTDDLAVKPRVGACDVHKDSYNGSHKDEDLADASSPPNVVVDKVIVVVRSVENPDNADVATVGQCSEAVVVLPQPSGGTILGSQAVMEDCAIEISPKNSGSLVGDGLNTDVASGPDGGKVAPSGSSHEILMLRCKDEHYTVYMMNRYRGMIDIHDIRRYIRNANYTTKWHMSDYHSDCTEVVVASFIQEAVVDKRTLRTFLLCRIGAMFRQHHSTYDEVEIIGDAAPNIVEEALEEIGGDATELPSQKRAICEKAAVVGEGREGRGGSAPRSLQPRENAGRRRAASLPGLRRPRNPVG